MTHFLALVIGPDAEKQLAPYHEFECTGMVDEYVQSVDITAEKLEEYLADSNNKLQDADGNLFDPWDTQFYRDPTEEESALLAKKSWGHDFGTSSRDWNDGLGYRTKVNFVPEGYTKVQIKTSDVMSFATYLSKNESRCLTAKEAPQMGKDEPHMWGWHRVNADNKVLEVINRTNPNSRWDWWVYGGRYSNFLSYTSDMEGQDFCKEVPVKLIDFEAMRCMAEEAARQMYREVEAHMGSPLPKLQYLWKDLSKDETLSWDARRELYNGQELLQKFRSADADFRWYNYDEFSVCTEEEYADRARNNACTPYVIVKDGIWYEKGKMGWWCVSSNEVDDVEWAAKVSKLLDDLGPDDVISVVDCHI